MSMMTVAAELICEWEKNKVVMEEERERFL